MTGVKERVMTEVVEDLLISKFERFAPDCSGRIVDSGGGAVCCYHSDSASDCRFGICAKMDLSLDEAAEILEGEETREKNESSTP